MSTKPMLNDKVMEEVMNNIAKISEEKQFLLANCIENLLNGSSWGVMNKGLLKSYPDPLKYNNGTTKVYAVDKTYLVDADYQSALKTLQQVAPNLVDNAFAQDFIKEVKANIESFKAFISKSEKTGFKGFVGFYSINKTETMTYMKKREKAFQLSLETVLGQLSDQSVRFYVQGQYIAPSQFKANFKEYINFLDVSEGTTALVVPMVIQGAKK
ncbi:hypothetical protein COF68_06075 [Bacillus toyonensis]|uniref:hypothetical protein n=1 Tax=Bacillus toyonensis TaxID=155322 RepID=UPI000BFCA9C1|nr:hypothetical protein [Bacillus toyonensis]PHE64401.1 hypothetical protein COF68_06075 [Bacillus toyonensis]